MPATLPADRVYEYFGSAARASVHVRFWQVMSLVELGRFAEAAGHGAEAIRLAEPTARLPTATPYRTGVV